MSAPEGGEDWQAGLDAVDARLLDEYQSGIPIEERPFRAVGETLGASEQEVLARIERLRDRGIVRRFGAVLNPPVIGSSTLAALNAPEDRFAEIAEIVNGYRQVNHNYRRDHDWNVWFVVTAGSRATRDRVLDEIEARTGCAVLRLPMLTDYYIDLEFPVVNADRFARESTAALPPSGTPGAERARANGAGAEDADRPIAGSEASADGAGASATRIAEDAVGGLSALEVDVLLAIQDGLPLTATPYRDVASGIDAPMREVLAAIQHLLDDKCIKRIGCVVNHVRTGFDANCMVVWDVPDAELDARGTAVGALPSVTLCYHRPRRPEQDWPYNLFTMIHGRDPNAVAAEIDTLAAEHLPFPHERLHSTATLKQTGARYEELVSG
jgi:DNA-binding Lrp family transcriptional regulator